MSAEPVVVTPAWLALREPADAAARAADLVTLVQRYLPGDRRSVIHDLGCGTGSMARWLAPRLTGAQHWIMYDRQDDLLAVAAAEMPTEAADGAAITVETRRSDITRLDANDLAGASLITASALLDMMTADELHRFVASCVEAHCPALVTISVVGRVDLSPVDPLDARIEDAFNAHQRRTTGGGNLLGPDAFGIAVEEFTQRGVNVLLRPSPWQLDAAQADLAAEWFTGWIGAAVEQRPELTAVADAYAQRRLTEAAAGRLSVSVHHHDLLALPR